MSKDFLSREVVNSLRESYSNFNNFHSFRNLNDILIFLQDYICKFIYISNIMSIILNKNIRFTNFSKLCGTRFYDFIFSHGFTNTIRSYRQLFVFFTRIEKLLAPLWMPRTIFSRLRFFLVYRFYPRRGAIHRNGLFLPGNVCKTEKKYD